MLLNSSPIDKIELAFKTMQSTKTVVIPGNLELAWNWHDDKMISPIAHLVWKFRQRRTNFVISDEFEILGHRCGGNDGWFCVSDILLVRCIHFIQTKKWDSDFFTF